MFNSFLPHMPLSNRAESRVRALLFLYLGLVLCPVQYWPFDALNGDNTWYLALNYAATHHLVMGQDIVWTSGPLAYLAAPQDIGSNLVQGLLFQGGLWALLLIILWDLFFRRGLPLMNLAFFSIFLGLSGALYPVALGQGDLLLAAALLLLVQFQLRGGMGRYVTALVLLGVIPLLKFVGAPTAAGVVGGLIVDRIVHRHRGAALEAALAVAVPVFITATGYWLTMGSFHNWAIYLKSSLELSSGFSLAMSTWGPPTELLAAFETLVLLAVALAILRRYSPRLAVFFVFLLAAPLFLSFKHGFTRQDAHISHFFCFVAIALGLVVLVSSLEGQRTITSMVIVTLLFIVIWQDNVARTGPKNALGVTAIRTPFTVLPALSLAHLRHELKAKQRFPDDLRIEPEIKAIVQHEPIASLSVSYVNVFLEDLNLVLYPVLQRYSAYTPYLDQLNADWVRDKGPRFLIFDGKSIDGRHPWMETPAMWVEIYRWYDTRMLGAHNLLLERRKAPRFTRLEPLTRMQLAWGDELRLPASSQPVFFNMRCSMTKMGKLRESLFRVLEVNMTRDERGGATSVTRVVPAVLEAPVMGNYLPSNLAEFAEVFGPGEVRNFSVEKLKFSGPGTSAYAPACALEFLRPVR